MRPVPPAQLERLLLTDAHPEDAALAQSMRELLTKLLIQRRTDDDNRLVGLLRKGEGFSDEHITALLRDKLKRWLRRWQDGADGVGSDKEDGEAGDGEGAIVDDPHREYDGPDFDSFGELPALDDGAFSFSSLSVYQRVVLLHCLCDEHLSFSDSFATTVRAVQPRDARIPPLATDVEGHRYYFFQFPD